MSQAAPGWYPDPNGEPAWRYWDGTAWTAHRSPPAAPEPAPAARPSLSPSTLVYLFAGKFARPRPLVGLRVPCPPARVDGPRVATEMLAVAWWSLREAGAVRFESAVGQKKSRLQAVLVDPALGGNRHGGRSLETALVRLAMRDGNRTNVGGQNEFFQSSDDGPYGSHEIARFARTEAASLGYLSAVGSSGLPLRGDCERIARLEPQFDALWEAWQRFASAEQPLHALLVKDAESSVPGYWG